MKTESEDMLQQRNVADAEPNGEHQRPLRDQVRMLPGPFVIDELPPIENFREVLRTIGRQGQVVGKAVAERA